VEWLLERGVQGFVVLGSTGEAPHLSDEEALDVVGAVVDTVARRVPVMVGSGRASTRQTLHTIERFACVGADASLVLTPFYYRAQMQPQSWVDYYDDLARESPLPLFLYHFPQVTGLELEAHLLVEILQQANVWGFKDSSASGGPLADALRETSTHAFVGSAARIVEALEAGASGGILAVAHLVPEACVRLLEAWRAGDHARAAELQVQVRAVAESLQGWAIAGVKCGLARRGQPVGIPRPPLLAAPEAIEARVAEALDAALQST
jgi:dihydrodipicolinate synthase/N-acetylneuraminate lyase